VLPDPHQLQWRGKRPNSGRAQEIQGGTDVHSSSSIHRAAIPRSEVRSERLDPAPQDNWVREDIKGVCLLVLLALSTTPYSSDKPSWWGHTLSTMNVKEALV